MGFESQILTIVGAPIRPRHIVPTQQGVGTLAPNDLTPCRMAFYFVSTFAIAQTPTKQPALSYTIGSANMTLPSVCIPERPARPIKH
jgi:hypothetical protein